MNRLTPLTLAENLVVAGLKAHPAENRTALGLGLGLAVGVGVGVWGVGLELELG